MKIKFMDRFSARTKCLVGTAVITSVAAAVSYRNDLAVSELITDSVDLSTLTDSLEDVRDGAEEVMENIDLA